MLQHTFKDDAGIVELNLFLSETTDQMEHVTMTGTVDISIKHAGKH